MVAVNERIYSWEGEDGFRLFNLYRSAFALFHTSIGVVLLTDWTYDVQDFFLACLKILLV